MDTEKRFHFMRHWSDYLNESTPEEQLSVFKKEWNMDLESLLNEVKEAESKVEIEKTPKRVVVVSPEIELS